MKLSLKNAKKAFHFVNHIFVTDRLDERERDFIKHNEAVWGCSLHDHDNGEVLLESSSMSSSIIAFSYMANLLAKVHQARIIAYAPGRKSIKTQLANRKVNRIYRSFNVTNFIYHELNPSQLQDVEQLFNMITPYLKTKKDVEDLKIEGTWIGDLLYDSHCMDYKVPTISFDDPRFDKSLKNAIWSYVFWRDYLNTHNVKSVIVSHTVYIQSGVITRLAIERKVPVYQVSATHVYYLTNKNLWAYNDFYYYPEQFSKISNDKKEKGLKLAKERLQQRFSGQVGVDMRYSTKSAYKKIHNKNVLKKNEKTKILVATHCFFDSPHPYGVNLFPDFYEWLYFLGEVSKKTDYDWYIKTHPDFLPGNIPIIEKFIEKYPKFTFIPSDTSHLQLIEEGIKYGLTVYGTIGFEYAALGMPVINASLCNPYIRYNFNIHPGSIEEYERILMDLDNQKLEININEVYEYYYMRFIENYMENWLYSDYNAFLEEIGGYKQQFTPIAYEKFLAEFSQDRHGRKMQLLDNFIESKDYCMQKKHYND